MTPTCTSDTELPVFDFAGFFAAVNAARVARGLGWYDFAAELWDQSADLNAARQDHPLCGGAVSRLGGRGETDCQYALFLLRWLGRAPEDFLIGPVVDVGDTRLPTADPAHRLRWDLGELHAAMDERRRAQKLTWVQLGQIIGCTPNRLTNFRTARQADVALAMRAVQWAGRPAAAFVHAAAW